MRLPLELTRLLLRTQINSRRVAIEKMEVDGQDLVVDLNFESYDSIDKPTGLLESYDELFQRY
jgi:hypothetical protein